MTTRSNRTPEERAALANLRQVLFHPTAEQREQRREQREDADRRDALATRVELLPMDAEGVLRTVQAVVEHGGLTPQERRDIIDALVNARGVLDDVIDVCLGDSTAQPEGEA